MSNPHVDSIFRNILNAVTPPEEKVVMTATNKASQEVLKAAADALCNTNDERTMLQMVYNLGKLDGRAEATLAAIQKFSA